MMFPGKYCSDFAMQITSDVMNAQTYTINFQNNNLSGTTSFLEGYKSSKTRICVTVGMMTTGYDCEDLLNIGLLRPIFSPTDFIQIKGRGTRKHDFIFKERNGGQEIVHKYPKETFKLPDPFLVLATQNPIEQEGTYQLPEAQVDRFMLKVLISYPSAEEERRIVRQNISGEQKKPLRPILTTEEIHAAREVVRSIYIDEKIEKYIVDIVFATRYPEKHNLKDLKALIEFGCSPRASINLALASRAYAFIHRRGYVIPEDVRAVAHDVLRHRIGLSYEAEATNVTSDDLINDIINKVEVP